MQRLFAARILPIATAFERSGLKQAAKAMTAAPATANGLDAVANAHAAAHVDANVDASMSIAAVAAHVPAGMFPARPWRLPPRELTRL